MDNTLTKSVFDGLGTVHGFSLETLETLSSMSPSESKGFISSLGSLPNEGVSLRDVTTMARILGKRGGKARARRLSPEARSAIAREAARVRHSRASARACA